MAMGDMGGMGMSSLGFLVEELEPNSKANKAGQMVEVRNRIHKLWRLGSEGDGFVVDFARQRGSIPKEKNI